MMRWVILGNGPLADYTFARQMMRIDDFVLCCDGGIRHAHAMQIMPDLVLGDLDSADPTIVAHYREANVPFEVFPAEKDFTDMELAIQHAADNRADEILILAGIGGRLDHTLANMHILLYALDLGISAVLADEKNTVHAMHDTITIAATAGTIVSLIPADGTVHGVTTTGLYYPLSNETLYAGKSRGVSNVMTGECATITATAGRLFVIQSAE